MPATGIGVHPASPNAVSTATRSAPDVRRCCTTPFRRPGGTTRCLTPWLVGRAPRSVVVRPSPGRRQSRADLQLIGLGAHSAGRAPSAIVRTRRPVRARVHPPDERRPGQGSIDTVSIRVVGIGGSVDAGSQSDRVLRAVLTRSHRPGRRRRGVLRPRSGPAALSLGRHRAGRRPRLRRRGPATPTRW